MLSARDYANEDGSMFIPGYTLWAKKFFFLFVCVQFYGFYVESNEASQQKVIICGVGKDIEQALPNTIKNIEALGNLFADYAVIIYENNSKDNTAKILEKWSKKNNRVTFISEHVSKKKLPGSRTEKIARARNIVLALARDPAYSDYKYLVMADLDFLCRWPIETIVKTLDWNTEWDCVSANGCSAWGGEFYWDRYAFREASLPFGPELMGDNWWGSECEASQFALVGHNWLRVYSAFGGLAIYKTESILSSSYSGIVTGDLQTYYSKIIRSLSRETPQLKHYLVINDIRPNCKRSDIPIIFRENSYPEHPANYGRVTCCEHVPLHATMALNGYGKFYINPELFLQY